MNVVLVSQCDKRALSESRRILDQFAERKGDRTWQTSITQDGLTTLRKLLRRTARKNTAVACHWIRGRDHSELMWIVGEARRFNAEGTVPTGTTESDVLRRKDENDWHSLSLIRDLAALAALLHDLGKACRAFQDRLKAKGPPATRNEYRHEWISLRLFEAFVGPNTGDEDWLRRLIEPSSEDDASWIARLVCSEAATEPDARYPFRKLPPLARAVGWLVLTHHRLPALPPSPESPNPAHGVRRTDRYTERLEDVFGAIACDWNEAPKNDLSPEEAAKYWTFESPLPVVTPLWRKRAARLAIRLLASLGDQRTLGRLVDPFVMHLARLSLMMADHHYSSLIGSKDRLQGQSDYPLYANTRRDTGDLNQPLDEHLLGVERHAAVIARSLPGFDDRLPRLARHPKLRRRSQDARFRWQDRATDLAASVRERARVQGAFVVNMASTGCGKTLANARVMNALADPNKGFRCAFAMGLRTLTLQTGRAFRDLLDLGEDELAIQVGGAPNRELFEHYAALAEVTGSASIQALVEPDDNDSHVLYEGNDEDDLLRRLTRDVQARRLLHAPLLVCTVDHLMPATESLRGGHQMVPMLRLLSGDLVLDEPDDFDVDDLPALTRLVNWAGMLGTRVLLSSATLPPAIVEGLFLAYLEGRRWYQRNRGERPLEPVNLCCLWIDEYDADCIDCADGSSFQQGHQSFVSQRHARLGREAVRRRAELLPLSLADLGHDERRQALATVLRDAAVRLHAAHHSIDPCSNKRVSFGLIRMANVAPLFDVALALYRLGAPEGLRIHLCVYHSQFPLAVRSDIEHRLDSTLDRRRDLAVFELDDIRQRIDASDEADQLFVVLGSPVTEVGRDHDYDWGVVEPSSMRSLIQLAGRIRRHRPQATDSSNLLILERNLRSFERPSEPSFCKPGFETGDSAFRLTARSLRKLLRPDERDRVDARPRIVQRAELHPTENLVDLEHARLAKQMLPPQTSMEPVSSSRQRRGMRARLPEPNAASCWHRPGAWLSGILPQQQPFRAGQHELEFVLLPDEDETRLCFCRFDRSPSGRSMEPLAQDNLIERVPDEALQGVGIQPWGDPDMLGAMRRQAEAMDMDLHAFARRFASVSLRASENDRGWRFHPLLGFVRRA